MLSAIPFALARVGGGVDALVNGEWGARGVKVGLKLLPFRHLQWFSRFSPLAFSVTTVSTLFAGIAALTSLVGERPQQEREEASETLIHSSLLVANLMSRYVGPFQLFVQLGTAAAGAVQEVVGIVIAIRKERPWYDQTLRIGMFLIFNGSKREWQTSLNRLKISCEEWSVRRSGVRLIKDWDRGRLIHRAELPDGSYTLCWDRLVRGDRTVRVLRPGARLGYDFSELQTNLPGRNAVYFKGVLYENRGPLIFEDDFGNRLRTVMTERRVTVYPEEQLLHPYPPFCHPDLTVPYKGRSFRLEPHQTAGDYYLATAVSGTQSDEYLFYYNRRERRFQIGPDIVCHPTEGQAFYYQGKRFQIEFEEGGGGVRHCLGRSVSDPDQLIAIEKGEFGDCRLFERAVFDHPKEGIAASQYLTYGGKTYLIEHRDDGFVYASLKGQPTGREENWFVGRVVPGGFGLVRQTVISLTSAEMRDEFYKQVWRLEVKADRHYGGWKKGQPFPTELVSRTPETNFYETKGVLVSGRQIELQKYTLMVGDRHLVELYLPPKKDRFYSLDDWIKLLRDLPPRSLYSTKQVWVVPQGERMRRGALGIFFTDRQEMYIQDGYRKDKLVREVLFHEMVGHGFERNNWRIRGMIIMAMKLDRRRISGYGTKHDFEYHAEAANFLFRYPSLRRIYPHQWDLVEKLPEVDPREIPVSLGTMWFHRAVRVAAPSA